MSFQNKLIKYKKLIDNELDFFLNKKIMNIYDKDVKSDYENIKNFILHGGKRLRPISLLIAYQGVSGKDSKNILTPALSVELVHNSTLVHDDIMDEDELRRNNPTIFKKYKDNFVEEFEEKNYEGILFNKISSRFGVSKAILDGNILLSLAYEALSISSNQEVMDVLNRAYRTVVEGQIMDIMTEFSPDVTEGQYIEMITKKTATLFESSIKIGAILGGASDIQIDNLSKYAINAAIAFQIKDDLMDISKDSKKGHEFCSDIKQGKKNLLIIKGLEIENEEDKEKIKKVFGNSEAKEDELDNVVKILENNGILKYVEDLALEKIKIAKEYLNKTEISKQSLEFFNDLAVYFLNREL